MKNTTKVQPVQWIKDRPPNESEADDFGHIAHYDPYMPKFWVRGKVAIVKANHMPWLPIREILDVSRDRIKPPYEEGESWI